MRNVYLAIDSGTSSVRVVFFNEDMTTHAFRALKRIAVGEIDAETEWRIIADLIKHLVMENEDCIIAGVAVTQYLAWVPIDTDGRSLTKVFLYTDQKETELNDFNLKFDTETFYKRTGRKPTAELAALKLLYIKKHYPDIYEKTRYLVSLKDYINFKLTNNICMDYTFAGYSMVFNINKLEWDNDILAALELDKSKFPPLQKCSGIVGHISDSAAVETELTKGTPVALGGPDGSVGVLWVPVELKKAQL